VNLLDRFLLSAFFRKLLLVMGGLISIYLLVDFFERVDNFLESGKTTGLALKYLFLKLPFIFEQLLPVGILLAGVITLGVLNHHHELMALLASGVGIPRIVRPLLIGALAATLVGLAASQWIIPPTMAETNRIWNDEVKQEKTKGVERQGRTFHRGREGIVTFIRKGPHTFTSFLYTSWDDRFQTKTHLAAERAVFLDGRWVFVRGQLKPRNQDGSFSVRLFDRLEDFPLPETPEDFFVPPYKSSERSLTELAALAMDPDAPDGREALLALHKRISYLCLGLPLLLLGIPVLLLIHRGRGRDLALAIPASCGIAFGAWGLWSAGQAMAASSTLSPWIFAWPVHLLAAAPGILYLKRQGG